MQEHIEQGMRKDLSRFSDSRVGMCLFWLFQFSSFQVQSIRFTSLCVFSDRSDGILDCHPLIYLARNRCVSFLTAAMEELEGIR